MPLNERKIISIILQECKSVDERCDGYREEIMDVLAEIMDSERQHLIKGTNIQQRVKEKCKLAGQNLAEKRKGGGEK